MRKSTLFISALLTTFVMAMLAGVASAYQNIVFTDQLAAFQPQSPANTQTQATAAVDTISTEVQAINWTPEEAAGLAAQVLDRDDLYSVEVTDLNGETVFMVTFSSGDLVYVSLDGQIRFIGKVQVETVVVNSGGGGGSGNNNQPAASNQNHEDDDHEDQEDHEDDEDDEEHEEDDD